MTFSNQQKCSAKNQFDKTAQDININDIRNTIINGEDKLHKLLNKSPNKLKDLWNDIKLMLSLLRDYSTGLYSNVPWKIIASISASIIYFVSPIDAIPDFIPIFGYIDDAFVIKLALDFAQDDLTRYKKWQSTQQ
ncbi:YkvA family protein [uncultured Psychromonas sp.]|uniref:YkvA family protein n=1 Tax=uncultured Psychromonas sp. TaxID=173974 RepID=UPI00262A7DCF|nr:YkvA family protein [uncultured Psychromonas sp.]